jgi:hypothetical protein
MDWTIKTVQDRCKEDGLCWVWTQCINDAGYPIGTINGKRGSSVRKFLYTELLGKRLTNGHVITSRCHNKRCVSPDCLVQRTRGDILRDMYARGARTADAGYIYRQRKAINDRPDYVKLDQEKAREIRARLADGEAVSSLAAAFGVSEPTIRDIRRNRSWREFATNSSVFAWVVQQRKAA